MKHKLSGLKPTLVKLHIIDLCHAAAVFCTTSLVLTARLTVQKQSFFNLLEQNGRRVTEV